MKQTIFTCDACEKKSNATDSFPYLDGWVYIFSASFKIKNEGNIEMKDKHFCSQTCLATFILHSITPEKKGVKK